MARVKKTENSEHRKMRPALTPEARENQLIALATDLVEKRLIEGTASSQETTHFLKLATTKARLEKEILEKQKELIEAKTQNLKSIENSEKLYADALSRVFSTDTKKMVAEEKLIYSFHLKEVVTL